MTFDKPHGSTPAPEQQRKEQADWTRADDQDVGLAVIENAVVWSGQEAVLPEPLDLEWARLDGAADVECGCHAISRGKLDRIGGHGSETVLHEVHGYFRKLLGSFVWWPVAAPGEHGQGALGNVFDVVRRATQAHGTLFI